MRNTLLLPILGCVPLSLACPAQSLYEAQVEFNQQAVTHFAQDVVPVTLLESYSDGTFAMAAEATTDEALETYARFYRWNFGLGYSTQSFARWEFQNVVFESASGVPATATIGMDFTREILDLVAGNAPVGADPNGVAFRIDVSEMGGTPVDSSEFYEPVAALDTQVRSLPAFAVLTDTPLRVRIELEVVSAAGDASESRTRARAQLQDPVFDLAGTTIVSVDSGDGFSGNSLVALVVPTDLRDGALVDVDNDGHLDVVTANAGTSDVAFWGNDGLGAFTLSGSVALSSPGPEPVALAVGDLDGNAATVDVAVACASSHVVELVTDLGGTPGVVAEPSGGLRPVDVAVGDLNGAGSDDIVVAREGLPLGGGAGIAVRLDSGAFVDIATDRAFEVVLADLDGNGDLDLAALADGSPQRVLLFDGDGAGGFTAAGFLTLDTNAIGGGLCADDLDGDGDVDLAVGQVNPFAGAGTGTVKVFTNDGSSTLAAANFTATGTLATGGDLVGAVAAGDLDDNSFPGYATRRELIAVLTSPGDAVALYDVDPATPSSAGTTNPTVGANPIALAIGDLNGDGADDVVIVNQGSDDLSVTFGTVGALTETFGTGCAGTPGIPVITTIDTPTTGSTTFGRQLSNARAFAPELSFFSFGQQDTVLGSGCTLYLADPLASTLRFTDGIGEDSYLFGVPNDPGLIGLEIYLQDAVFDPNGALFGVFAVSNALRARVGA